MSARPNNELQPSNAYRTAWTTTPVDYNIKTNDPAKDKLVGRPCRTILIATPGTLVVTGPDGTNVTFPSGFTELPIQAIALVASGTTAQGVVVLW